MGFPGAEEEPAGEALERGVWPERARLGSRGADLPVAGAATGSAHESAIGAGEQHGGAVGERGRRARESSTRQQGRRPSMCAVAEEGHIS